MINKKLYEILVPTIHKNGKFITTRFHKVWDKKVRDITGGLTINQPAKGYWVSPNKELVVERMIPVKIMCTEEQMSQIVTMSKKYYNQDAIMYYCISSEVYII